jgi:hypothetical protein
MRTKTLLVAAALAAGLATSMAQNVYSLNVVGYYNVTVPANSVGNGLVIAANQLTNTAGSDISVVIPPASVPENTTVYAWNGTTYVLRIRTSDDDDNAIWSNTLPLPPGTAFWVQNPTASPITVTFVGEVLQGDLAAPVPAGLSMKASQVPQSGDLASVLNYPAVPESTTVYFWRNAAYQLRLRTTDDDDNAIWNQPTVPDVGEGFWVQENAPLSWTRTFTVPQN